ncbi:hypothetical protein BDZ91DRAFT_751424 [Kalaharituber pfeilii]|nr:hypothetical protein BDZ91DRAFT_751424 [Kalaharituber pfeilii]
MLSFGFRREMAVSKKGSWRCPRAGEIMGCGNFGFGCSKLHSSQSFQAFVYCKTRQSCAQLNS